MRHDIFFSSSDREIVTLPMWIYEMGYDVLATGMLTAIPSVIATTLSPASREWMDAPTSVAEAFPREKKI